MHVTRSIRLSVTVGGLLLAGAAGFAVIERVAVAQGAPAYRNVPFWPQPLPNHWVLGSVTGAAVDAQDHV